MCRVSCVPARVFVLVAAVGGWRGRGDKMTERRSRRKATELIMKQCHSGRRKDRVIAGLRANCLNLPRLSPTPILDVEVYRCRQCRHSNRHRG